MYCYKVRDLLVRFEMYWLQSAGFISAIREVLLQSADLFARIRDVLLQSAGFISAIRDGIATKYWIYLCEFEMYCYKVRD